MDERTVSVHTRFTAQSVLLKKPRGLCFIASVLLCKTVALKNCLATSKLTKPLSAAKPKICTKPSVKQSFKVAARSVKPPLWACCLSVRRGRAPCRNFSSKQPKPWRDKSLPGAFDRRSSGQKCGNNLGIALARIG